jgi:NADPH:quinone reductase-like Zn-dependent oxidoreductase
MIATSETPLAVLSESVTTMQAAVYKKYGAAEVVTIAKVAKPAVGPGLVLVRVKATTVTSGDCRLRTSNFPKGMFILGRLAMGIFGPRNQILGAEFSGDVEAVGSGCTKFKVGDAVVGGRVFGCHAQYLAMPETGALAHKPAGLNYTEGACLAFGPNTALNFLQEQAKLQPGESVLIVGASGSVGSAAIQIAKILGAGEVTAVCSAKNAGLVTSLGADKVIDYAQEDFAKNGTQYDVIFDTTGTRNWANTRQSLSARGRLCLAVASLGEILMATLLRAKGNQRACAGVATPTEKSMQTLVQWAVDGRLHPVIDSEFSLTEIAMAHAVVGTGHKRGNVVVKVA